MNDDALLANLLRESGRMLALAESCTGGMIAARITAVPASSLYFSGGIVAYSNELKMKLLQVPAPMLAMYGAVSDEVARAMADGVRKATGSDLALSVTGIAGPDGGTSEKPVGTVFIAMSDGEQCRAQRFHFIGDREAVRQATLEAALKWLKQYLQST